MTTWKSDVAQKHGSAMTGRITELSPGRLCGAIRASNAQQVFFHGRDLEGAKYNDLKIGGLVSFELIDDRISGPRAARVRVDERATSGARPGSRRGADPTEPVTRA